MEKMKPPASALQKWDRGLSLAAKKEESNEISILSEIGPSDWGGMDAKTVKQRLDAIGKKDVVVQLNTPGGDAFEGIAIYNLLREHKGKVFINVLGLAASAGSIIAMAGDQIRMAEASQMMIHSSWGLVAGNKNDLRDFAATLDGLDSSIAQLYANRTGLPIEKVKAMMDAETWMSADQAVEHRFADIQVVTDEKKKKMSARAQSMIAVAADNAVGAMRAAMRVSFAFNSTTRPGSIDISRIKSDLARATHGAQRQKVAPRRATGFPDASGPKHILLPE
jgi:ATP-dependent Clp protease protease subunit